MCSLVYGVLSRPLMAMQASPALVYLTAEIGARYNSAPNQWADLDTASARGNEARCALCALRRHAESRAGSSVVEHGAENAGVGGSIPPLPTT